MLDIKSKDSRTEISAIGSTEQLLTDFSHAVAAVAYSMLKPFNKPDEFDVVVHMILMAAAKGVSAGTTRRKSECEQHDTD